jgi:hypothetical protein
VTDVAPIARDLTRLEQVPNTEIAAELRAAGPKPIRAVGPDFAAIRIDSTTQTHLKAACSRADFGPRSVSRPVVLSLSKLWGPDLSVPGYSPSHRRARFLKP